MLAVRIRCVVKLPGRLRAPSRSAASWSLAASAVASWTLAISSITLLAPSVSFAGTNFGAPLDCKASTGAVRVLDTAGGGTADDMAWARAAMAKFGLAGAAEVGPDSRATGAAMLMAKLFREGNIIAAQMASEEAVASIPAFASSPFASAFTSLLEASTQPIAHASMGGFLSAEGEAKSPSGSEFSVSEASASLHEIYRRATYASQVMQARYELASVRYYLLAAAFHDGVGFKAAAAGVCQLKAPLSAAELRKLSVAARFMAMPGASESEVGHRDHAHAGGDAKADSK